MQITTVWRYPVKSMLGERLDDVRLTEAGLAHDRALALVDRTTGLVATAKHPRLWRTLLAHSAAVDGERVLITSPAGWTREATAPGVDELLSDGLGRAVRVASERPDGATVERPAPEDVLDQGVDAVVAAATLQIGQGTPGTTFVDYAPVHLITSATLAAIGAEQVRYRPNLVVETPPGTPGFVENSWVGREFVVGEAVLRIALPTPRCAVPTLEHGPLPRAPHAVRTLMADNRVDVPGFGVLPCAGCYAEVVRPGVVRVGDEVVPAAGDGRD
ncbi:MOSC N-terminal beta barrel domain-containing protein [Pseudonocardia sp. MH-G8]|uniref:MOSC domain-containing protein n=1 Tax=Pseudonocardia sp. MH-G8 TaxID=1854588 RepID=UPI000B9FF1EB|nr:MOSC N-terminal beta barrel domain-containing protein [Pseudonocardia sp. MH-G8]OZM81034.1 molybdenum cofactor biosysynthesis protein [Pseudonocardia sp. MH-G8]